MQVWSQYLGVYLYRVIYLIVFFRDYSNSYDENPEGRRSDPAPQSIFECGYCLTEPSGDRRRSLCGGADSVPSVGGLWSRYANVTPYVSSFGSGYCLTEQEQERHRLRRDRVLHKALGSEEIRSRSTSWS